MSPTFTCDTGGLWPGHTVFSTFDSRPGEEALVSSSLFGEHTLSLCRGAALSDLSRSDGTGHRAGQEDNDLADYLVCSGSDVLLCIAISDRAPWYGVPARPNGIPFVETTAEQLAGADVKAILSMLDMLLRQRDAPQWKLPLCPIPPAWQERFTGMGLLERRQGYLLPTEYGTCSKLTKVLSPRQPPAAMCSPQVLERLTASDQRIPVPMKRPLARRITEINSGFAAHYAAAKFIQRLVDMPLSAYMDGYPNEEERLNVLVSPCATYHEAVRLIRDMIHSGTESDHGRGIEAMKLLAVLTVTDCRVYSGELPPSEGAVPSCNAPPEEPDRRFRARLEGLRQKACFSFVLYALPIRSFFEGMTLLAHTGYPTWLCSAMRCTDKDLETYTYGRLLCRAADMLKEPEKEQETFLNGLRLMELLLIEPFQVIPCGKKFPEKE